MVENQGLSGSLGTKDWSNASINSVEDHLGTKKETTRWGTYGESTRGKGCTLWIVGGDERKATPKARESHKVESAYIPVGCTALTGYRHLEQTYRMVRQEN